MIVNTQKTIRFIDLFCGIGGFRYAIEDAVNTFGIQAECALSSDIDAEGIRGCGVFGMDVRNIAESPVRIGIIGKTRSPKIEREILK